MYPRRLSPGPLPADLAHHLLRLTPATTSAGIPVEAPFTGETIGIVPAGTPRDVDEAFSLARAAQHDWARRSPAYRRKPFRRFHSLVLRHRELLMDMIQLETGKNRAAAFDEVMDVASITSYYSANAGELLRTRRRRGIIPGLSRSAEHRHPLGVVGQISPWNYPLTLAISDAVPALLAGNAVVSKPDSATPFTALLITSLLLDAGLPEGLLQTVTGEGSVVGAAIAERCDYLMFTGSTATGRLLGETTGRRLIGFSAELGGKNPLIVAGDADLSAAVDGAVNGTVSNSGQLCVSIERIYLVGAVHTRFTEAFTERIRDLRLGAGFDWELDMGSLASRRQLESVQGFVDDAVAKGARVLAGGRARPDLGPYFFEPTVLTGVSDEMRLAREEVFGPVVYLEVVEDLAEAIVRANDSEYGLNAAVFAAPATARAAAPLIQSGGVNINDAYMATWANTDSALGGTKASGLSARHGAEGILKYTRVQNISEQRGWPLRGPSWLGRRSYAALMSAGLRALALIRR